MNIILVNSITLIRLLGTILLPIVVHFFGLTIATLLLIIVFITDMIDGFLARKLKCSTFFGAIFDSVCDKFLLIMVFLVLGFNNHIFFIAIFLELLIVAVCYKNGISGKTIKTSLIGKIKMWIISMCLVLTFFCLNLSLLDLNISNNVIRLVLDLFVRNQNAIISVFSKIVISAELVAIIDYYAIKNDKKNKSNNKLKINGHIKDIFRYSINPKFYSEHKNDRTKELIENIINNKYNY